MKPHMKYRVMQLGMYLIYSFTQEAAYMVTIFLT